VLVCLLVFDGMVPRMFLRALDNLAATYGLDVRQRLQESLADYRLQGERDQLATREAALLIDRELERAHDALEVGDLKALDQHLAASLSLAESTRAPYCANVVVASLLASKKRQCTESGIVLETQVSLPRELTLQDIEVASVFFNLIDNALHECEALRQEDAASHPHILVRSSIEANHLFVQVENPCRPDAEQRRRERRRAIGASRTHGWGTGIVRDVAYRHRGIAEFGARDGVFCASVLIPLSAMQPSLLETSDTDLAGQRQDAANAEQS